MYKFLLFLCLILTFKISHAQGFRCGTVSPPASALKSPPPPGSGPVPLSGTQPVNTISMCLNKTLSIAVHIVLDSVGQAGITVTAINDAINDVNGDFKPMCMAFTVCSVDSIRNFNYDNFYDKKHENEMTAIYNEDNRINMYFVAKLTTKDHGPVCGYAYFPGGPDVILIQKSCADRRTISHELGHFFGLMHTFETKYGIELVKRTNCVTAGDGLCDTEADAQGPQNSSCQYTGAGKDPNGDYYLPPVDNIMSYYNPPCTKKFTVEQYNKMIAQFLTIRNYLW